MCTSIITFRNFSIPRESLPLCPSWQKTGLLQRQALAALLPKLHDPDPDIRFMSLSDLSNILVAPASSYISSDSTTAARIVDGLLKSLTDTNGEVQNQALKW